MPYLAVRHLHITFVTLSICLFILRGGLQLAGIDWRRWRWLRILPHLNDTLLLVAAITLALMSHQYPFVLPWLTAKVLGLCGYIILGSLALRRNLPATQRAGYFAAALLMVAYIVAVAITRSATLGLV